MDAGKDTDMEAKGRFYTWKAELITMNMDTYTGAWSLDLTGVYRYVWIDLHSEPLLW